MFNVFVVRKGMKKKQTASHAKNEVLPYQMTTQTTFFPSLFVYAYICVDTHIYGAFSDTPNSARNDTSDICDGLRQ